MIPSLVPAAAILSSMLFVLSAGAQIPFDELRVAESSAEFQQRTAILSGASEKQVLAEIAVIRSQKALPPAEREELLHAAAIRLIEVGTNASLQTLQVLSQEEASLTTAIVVCRETAVVPLHPYPTAAAAAIHAIQAREAEAYYRVVLRSDQPEQLVESVLLVGNLAKVDGALATLASATTEENAAVLRQLQAVAFRTEVHVQGWSRLVQYTASRSQIAPSEEALHFMSEASAVALLNDARAWPERERDLLWQRAENVPRLAPSVRFARQQTMGSYAGVSRETVLSEVALGASTARSERVSAIAELMRLNTAEAHEALVRIAATPAVEEAVREKIRRWLEQ